MSSNFTPPVSTPVSDAVRLFEALPKYNLDAWSGWDPSVAPIGDVAFVNVREDGDTQTKVNVTLHEATNPVYQIVSVTLSTFRAPVPYDHMEEVHPNGVHKASFVSAVLNPKTTDRAQLAELVLRAIGIAELRMEG
jgi:hypothetical protein